MATAQRVSFISGRLAVLGLVIASLIFAGSGLTTAGCAGKPSVNTESPGGAAPVAGDFVVPPRKVPVNPEEARHQTEVADEREKIQKQLFLIDNSINEKRAEQQSYHLNPDTNFEFMVQQLEDDIHKLELQRQDLQREYNALQ